jgi:hypothetical protein
MTKPGAYEPPTLRALVPAEMPTSALLRRLAAFLAHALGTDAMPTVSAARDRALALEIAAADHHRCDVGDRCERCDLLREIGEVRP